MVLSSLLLNKKKFIFNTFWHLFGRLFYTLCAFLFFIHFAFVIALLSADRALADPAFPKPLIERYQDLQTKLTDNVFGAPIVLQSDTSKHHAQGDVFAVLDSPIADLKKMLSQTRYWCDLAILHINIKTCTFQKQQITFYLGRKYYQAPSQAYPLKYKFEVMENSDEHLYVKLSTEDGPFGTHDYSISFEAVPVDEQHSFIHFKYRYHFGFMARMAMNTYLATIGRHKVGFTIVGKDATGAPEYVDGVQGVVERNAMRYIFAIQSLLDARKFPVEDRQQQSLERWYEHISHHPVQLVEYTREEYLERKRLELNNQRTLQEELQKETHN